jgi:hypothetical protein
MPALDAWDPFSTYSLPLMMAELISLPLLSSGPPLRGLFDRGNAAMGRCVAFTASGEVCRGVVVAVVVVPAFLLDDVLEEDDFFRLDTAADVAACEATAAARLGRPVVGNGNGSGAVIVVVAE